MSNTEEGKEEEEDNIYQFEDKREKKRERNSKRKQQRIKEP